MPLPIGVLVFSALFAANVAATILLDPRAEVSTTLFGRSIALMGDLNGDGVPDLAVGAPFQDGDFEGLPGFGKPQNVGKVWVVDGATLTPMFTLDDPHYQKNGAGPQFGGELGSSVSKVGDLNGDGIPDIIAGNPHHVPEESHKDEEESKFNAGQAFVFSGADGHLLYTLDDPTPEEAAFAGSAVAGLGDVNDDRVPDLLVGVPGKDSSGGLIADVGIAYIYSGADGSLIRSVSEPRQQKNARFGAAVGNAGNIDQDGIPDILIGAPGRSKVFVFSGATGALIFTVTIQLDGDQPSFGLVVAGGTDLNKDGIADFAVGVPLYRHSRGAVFIYNGSDGSLQRKLSLSSPQSFARFGAAIYLSADLSGDGRPGILVGAPDQDVNGLINAGEVFIFSGATGKLRQSLTSVAPQAFAGFGSAITVADFDGDGILTPVVGTPYENADIVGSDGDVETHLQIGQIEIQ